MTQENLERQVLELVATDRIYIPMSSFDNKLKRQRPNLAKAIVDNEEFQDTGKSYVGERVYVRYAEEDKQVAKGMREGIKQFNEEYPKYGKILEGIIQAKRTKNECHLYFGMNEGRKLTQDDYLSVMQNLGLSEERSRELYPVVMDISRSISRKRDEERSVMLGKDEE